MLLGGAELHRNALGPQLREQEVGCGPGIARRVWAGDGDEGRQEFNEFVPILFDPGENAFLGGHYLAP